MASAAAAGILLPMESRIGSPRYAPLGQPRTRHAELLILCARIGYNP
ncbi:hypothetical protein SAMN06265365_103202 [Tistlia consotensis]|uniref:Uncharacterized protein n=1 Tax=Tistlia consotensis USBA 355 TaxID=560819 RepID=A0A1Y6BRF9_9PROT|nr:hypothetical protein SAMN05428998_10625 [Tistlia consotensis USBA 355]SNR41421.1 hypothetical protein SAMN06265365_103202 [Tistlia consotensis]